MNNNELVEPQSFPAALSAAVQNPENAEQLTEVVWSELQVCNIHRPFELPRAKKSYDNLAQFVDTEVKIQTEIMRSNIHNKICMVGGSPKEATMNQKAEKHLKIILPRSVTGRMLFLDLGYVQKEPTRGFFTNYIFVFQKREQHSGDCMENICLAYCTQMQKANGAKFILGRDADDRLSEMTAGTTIYARPLVNCNMWKAHILAISALKETEAMLRNSCVVNQLLRGSIGTHDMKNIGDLDTWIRGSKRGKKVGSELDLDVFNEQQQRALALNALTLSGLVAIQGPPGTGKSHIICHGILPQAVARNERVLVVCNSNVAVDALMLKCLRGDIPNLKGKIRRCGFKGKVSDEIVNLGLYVEGNISALQDKYGNAPGANSNTLDGEVQDQIRSTQIVFTTIHFASKEKTQSLSSDDYWRFDSLVLDEAAQIEDSKLMIMLARCPTLNKMILVGDPKQLQPYIPDSLRNINYGRSTMERVMDGSSNMEDVVPYVMLKEQFRMAPPLRSIVSNLFYNDQLQDAACVQKNGPNTNSIDLNPLLVVNITGTAMEYSRMHNSYENKAEADVVKVIYDLLFSSAFQDIIPGGDLMSNDVCILTPYNRHKDRLRMNICNISEDYLDSYAGQTFSSAQQTPVKSGSDTRSNRYSSTPLASPKKSQALFGTQDEVDEDTAARAENIDTVDKFQGSERKVVLISTCVHDKPRRAADPHFINVACSRSQHLLIIVGNFTNGLAGNKDWDYIKNQAMECGSYIDHNVTMNDNGHEISYDINKESIMNKLNELVGRRKKKGRRLFD